MSFAWRLSLCALQTGHLYQKRYSSWNDCLLPANNRHNERNQFIGLQKVSVSIYYSARRKKPLSPSEIKEIELICARYSVDSQIEKFLSTGVGLNWESFQFELNGQRPGMFKSAIVFSGSTKLPDNSGEATWIGVQHWCGCLSELRRLLNSCDWSASVEDHDLHWDSLTLAYDPQK